VDAAFREDVNPLRLSWMGEEADGLIEGRLEGPAQARGGFVQAVGGEDLPEGEQEGPGSGTSQVRLCSTWQPGGV